MKFSVLSSDLSKALAKIIGLVPTKSSLPILENVLFELTGNDLRMTASDLEITMRVNLPVNGMRDGVVAVPAKKLNETLRALPSTDVTVQADAGGSRLQLKTDIGEYRMAAASAGNYPEIEEVVEQFSLTMSGALLRTIVSTTVFAVSTDDLRPSMMGVLFQWRDGEFRAVATDGHRLVRVTHSGEIARLSGEEEREVIIPAKALNLLLRSLDSGEVSILFGKTNVRFSFADLQLTSRIIDERYPNYESVIPLENDRHLTVNRPALLAAVHRCSIFSNAVTNQVRFSIAPDSVRVFAEDIDFGGEARESLPATFTSEEELDVGYNARYISDALSHLESDEVTFSFSAPSRASLLRPHPQPEDLDILMLVMPLRLNA
ncbi:MAG: DNA polymerase III subunit beta [Bacteroidota bacterium]|nr:DNA polymerase III subunit beta [Bacteroidota bacterium]